MSDVRHPGLNPVLEVKRDAYLAAENEFREELLDEYKLSVDKVKHLHANLLFTTQNGLFILKDICLMVTQVKARFTNTNWRDLAAKLGYTDVDVKCMNNLRGTVYDPTEILLTCYAQTKSGASVGDILQALLDLGFLPAVHKAQKHIDDLLREVEVEKEEVIRTPVNTVSETKTVLKAANFKPFLPVIFDSFPYQKKTSQLVNFNFTNEVEAFQKAAPQPLTSKRQNKQYCKCVMLSFANDGYNTALRVASELRATTNKKGFPIGVLILAENEDIVQGNPGQVLPEILSKMDFVIPILTEGYFSALKNPKPQARFIDEQYVQYIHDIFVSKYIHNNCFNLQVRPVIPSQLVNTIYNKQEFIHSSIFNAWKSDDELPTLAENIVKSRRSKIVQF